MELGPDGEAAVIDTLAAVGSALPGSRIDNAAATAAAKNNATTEAGTIHLGRATDRGLAGRIGRSSEKRTTGSPARVSLAALPSPPLMMGNSVRKSW